MKDLNSLQKERENKLQKKYTTDDFLDVEYIKLKDLKGEPKYQRLINLTFLAKAKVFEPKLVKPLSVFRRPNGEYFIVDGQHTACLAGIYVYDAANFELPCQVQEHPSDFTIAPVGAIQKLLTKIDWNIDDVELFEINEAFAMVTMLAIQELNLDPAKVNLYGGACAQGHPIGSTGSRLVVTLAHAMKRLDKKRGIAALCIGGGEATAIALERS